MSQAVERPADARRDWYLSGPPCPRCARSAPISRQDRKSTRLNSSHLVISYAVFCLKKKMMLNVIDAGPPLGWDHADDWAARLRLWARSCERRLVFSQEHTRCACVTLSVSPYRQVV